MESPSPALPTSSPSAEARPNSQNLAHLPLSCFPAHRIHLLLPSSPLSSEPRLTRLPGLAACLTGSFAQSLHTHFLHACSVPGVTNNPAPWELHNQVGKIRCENNQTRARQNEKRTHTLCYMSTWVKGKRLGFGKSPRRVSVWGGHPLPTVLLTEARCVSQRSGARPLPAAETHRHL